MERNDHVVELAPNVVADEVAATRIDFRMADVATRLGISERTLARYFGGRDGLVREVAAIRDAAYVRRLAAATNGLADVLETVMEVAGADPSHVPLMRLNEQIEAGATTPADRARRAGYTDVSDTLARTVSGIPSEHLALGLIAVTVFPYAFPRWTETITGRDPRSEEFQADQDRFLVAAVGRLAASEQSMTSPAMPSAPKAPATSMSPSAPTPVDRPAPVATHVDLDERAIDLTADTDALPVSRAVTSVLDHARALAEQAGAPELTPAHLFTALRAMAPGLVDRVTTD